MFIVKNLLCLSVKATKRTYASTFNLSASKRVLLGWLLLLVHNFLQYIYIINKQPVWHT